jgi:hypothetical protein
MDKKLKQDLLEYAGCNSSFCNARCAEVILGLLDDREKLIKQVDKADAMIPAKYPEANVALAAAIIGSNMRIKDLIKE